MINLNAGKKNVAGAGLGIVAFTVTQILLRLINFKDNNTMILVGAIIAAGIFFVCVFNFGNKVFNKKPKIILSILFMLMCIFMAGALITTVIPSQSKILDILSFTMFFSSIASIIAFGIYLSKVIKKIR